MTKKELKKIIREEVLSVIKEQMLPVLNKVLLEHVELLIESKFSTKNPLIENNSQTKQEIDPVKAILLETRGFSRDELGYDSWPEISMTSKDVHSIANQDPMAMMRERYLSNQNTPSHKPVKVAGLNHEPANSTLDAIFNKDYSNYFKDDLLKRKK